MEEVSVEEGFGNSLLLESLKEALDQMVEEFYIEKDIGVKIYEEACSVAKQIIAEHSADLPIVSLTGRLKSYYCRNDVWTFFLKSTLFKFNKSKHKPTAKEARAIQPMNLKVHKNFLSKKEQFLKQTENTSNLKVFQNFSKLYAQILNLEPISTDVEDTTYYYDGIIKVLCYEHSSD